MTIQSLDAYRSRRALRLRLVVPQSRPVLCLLADTHILAMNVLCGRWGIREPAAESTRSLLYYHGRELSRAVDRLGEQLRELREPVPSPPQLLEGFGSLADLAVKDTQTVVRNLINGHESVARTAVLAIRSAQRAGDLSTLELARARRLAHERMRRGLLEVVRPWIGTQR